MPGSRRKVLVANRNTVAALSASSGSLGGYTTPAYFPLFIICDEIFMSFRVKMFRILLFSVNNESH